MAGPTFRGRCLLKTNGRTPLRIAAGRLLKDESFGVPWCHFGLKLNPNWNKHQMFYRKIAKLSICLSSAYVPDYCRFVFQETKLKKKYPLNGTRLRMSISAGDLIGKTVNIVSLIWRERVVA